MSSPRVPKESHIVNPETQYMGKPCKRGHDGLRFRSNGTCVECQRERQRSPEYRERERDKYRNDPQYREKQLKRLRERKADDPAYRRKRAIYMMYWHAKRKREEYGNKGYTLRDDDQEGRRGGDRTVAV